MLNKEYLAQRIKQKRKSDGLSLRATAPILDTSFTTISGLETGVRTPEIDLYFKICDWIGVPYGHFKA